jgi:hypothetical protein
MQLHINKSPNVNSEENLPAINGRGLAHRKLSRAERADLAADLVSGRRQFTPSLGQVSALLRVAPGIVREKLRIRARKTDTQKLPRQRRSFKPGTVGLIPIAKSRSAASAWPKFGTCSPA